MADIAAVYQNDIEVLTLPTEGVSVYQTDTEVLTRDTRRAYLFQNDIEVLYIDHIPAGASSAHHGMGSPF